jgi:NAD(P)-dependent dehydrogenase (short-subunit alcohol dehydrogenase family)
MTTETTPTLIQTPFGFDSTALEVVEGIDLTGKRAIVTGGASGIGIETARALASAGAEVTIAARDTAAAETVAADIKESTGNQAVLVAPLELVDRASIDAFANAWDGPLDILVNNAGVMAIQELTLAPNGHEMHFATNHLGHFTLALCLHDALASADGARVVSLSSRAHLRSPVVFDDIDFATRQYSPELAYAQSKTANVLFAVGGAQRWADDGIAANAVHPGAILDTNLSRHMDPKVLERLVAAGTYTFKTPEQGAATSALLAASPQLKGVSGRYFEDCNEPERVSGDPAGAEAGVAPHALDPASADRLWELSLELVAA